MRSNPHAGELDGRYCLPPTKPSFGARVVAQDWRGGLNGAGKRAKVNRAVEAWLRRRKKGKTA